MIVDLLEHCDMFSALNPLFEKAFAFLRDPATASLTPGRYELEGDKLFAMVQEYETRLPENCALEAHRRYIDIQFLLQGNEQIGYAPLSGALVEKSPYDAEKDIVFFNGIGAPVPLGGTIAAILFPQDAHAPGICCGASAPVRKVVVKVALPE